MDQEKPHDFDPFCLWTEAERPCRIGIVGTGPGLFSILELVAREEAAEFIPRLELVALAEPGPDRDRLAAARRARPERVPEYADFNDLLEHHPDIDLIIELTGSRERLKSLRQALPERVSLIDHASASFLCGMVGLLKSGAHRQRTLDRERALLAAITDEIQEDILLLDAQMRVVDCNRNVCERLSRPKEQVVGLSCRQAQALTPGEDFCQEAETVHCPFHDTKASHAKSERLLTRLDHEGRLRYFRVYTYPICDKLGRLTHVLVMRRDITRRTQAERWMQRSERLASVGEMSTFLAHELRNPLFAIAGFTAALARSPRLSDEERDKLAIIKAETGRIERMLKAILNFARPTPGTPGEVDLELAADSAAEFMRLASGVTGVTIRRENLEPVAKARGDADLVRQCLVDLIKNSLDALSGKGRVTVRTRMEEGMVAAEVEDDGPGMAPELIERVFSPFFSTKDKGFGLGLATIRKIIEDQDGQVEIKSTPSQGTTVTLLLPPALALGDGGAQ